MSLCQWTRLAPVPSARAVVVGHQVKLQRPTSVGARSRVVIEGEQKTQSTGRSND